MKPRVDIISHIYLEKHNRAKLSFLARDVELTVISPDQFRFAYGTYTADFREVYDYRVRVYPRHFPAGVHTSTRWILASRDLGWRNSPPDIIQIENEAHSFSLMQALIFRRLYAPTSKIVVFVWANHRLKGLKGIILNALANLVKPGIDHYITGNSEGKKLLVERGIPATRISTFPLVGIETNFYHPVSSEERNRLRAELGITPEEFIIGFVGRFVVDKGVHDLVQAFRCVSNQQKDARVRLLCVGDGPLKSDLTALSPMVIVVSPGGQGRVLPFYQIMDTLVLPSRTKPYWKEQFGLVLAEAMACGVPVIGSNSGAIPEVIGDAGFVFQEGDIQALYRSLTELIVGPDIRLHCSEAGKRRVFDTFSDSQIAQKTIRAYQQLAEAE